jgi:hypothetical protein
MPNPFPFTAGQVLTAAQMNGIGEPNISFTPTWSSTGTQPVLGNGSLTGKYQRVNKLVFVQMQLVLGSTTTIGTGDYRFTFPFAANVSYGFGSINSTGFMFDVSTSNGYNFVGSYSGGSTSVFRIVAFQNSTQTFGQFGAAYPIVPANGDEISISYVYEAA